MASLAQGLRKSVLSVLPAHIEDTLKLRALGMLKIPVLFFVSPSVVDLTESRAVVRIPLNYRTKNHLGSMYFGVLAAGADCAGGLIAWNAIEAIDPRVKLIFKDFHADFLKRPESDVHFTSNDGLAIRELVKKAAASGERENMPVRITATCPKKSGDEPVAEFTLTLSLKRK